MPAIILVVKLTSVSLQATDKNTKTPHIILIIYIYLYITKQSWPWRCAAVSGNKMLTRWAVVIRRPYSVAHVPIFGAFSSERGVRVGTLAGLRLCSPIHNKLQCSVLSETFLSEPAWMFCSLSCSSSPRASVSLGCSWPCCCITTVFSLDPFYRSWWLQTRNTPPQLCFWRCSVDPLPLGSGQNHPNPYAQLRR